MFGLGELWSEVR